MSDFAIRVDGLGKRYRLGERERYRTLRESWGSKFKNRNGLRQVDTFWALRDVAFEVNRGEVVGVIGRNGAGKSTLLKILSRITKPTTGYADIRGRVGSLLEVGTGFHPELTGRENIYLNGAILGMTRREVQVKFDEIVAFAEIEQFLDTPVKRYSSGMYVRLAFAVAAHLDPEILLVDEVLAVGDAGFQKKCLGKMGEVSRQGRTVIFISHNMAAVETLCQKAMVIDAGTVSYLGDVRVGIDAYISKNATAAHGGYANLTAKPFEHLGPQMLARLSSIELLDDKGERTEILIMGKPVRFRVGIDFRRAGADFEVGIALVNLFNVALHYLVSNWEGMQAIPKPGPTTIEVEVPALHIFPGTYQAHVWVKRQGGRYDDAVHGAVRFEVKEARLTPHYAYFERYSHGTQVYTPSRWRVVE